MTKEELYDLALGQYKDPAVFILNGRLSLGYWAPLKETGQVPVVLKSKTHAVVLVAAVDVKEGWRALAVAAGLVKEAKDDGGDGKNGAHFQNGAAPSASSRAG